MSVRMMTLVWELELPDSEKLVLLALADCANDEGHCWPGMRTLTKKCSKTDRTIQLSIKMLVAKGHLTRREVPGKGCNYTVHPIVRLASPEAPSPRSAFAPKGTTLTPEVISGTPEAASGKPSKNHHKPSPIKIARELPDDWEPVDFAIGSESQRVVDGWPPGEFAVQLEMFRAQHGKKGDKFVDWQKAWSTWVLNTRKFGIGNDGRTDRMGRHQPADGLSSTARAAIAVFGAPSARQQ